MTYILKWSRHNDMIGDLETVAEGKMEEKPVSASHFVYLNTNFSQ